MNSLRASLRKSRLLQSNRLDELERSWLENAFKAANPAGEMALRRMDLLARSFSEGSGGLPAKDDFLQAMIETGDVERTGSVQDFSTRLLQRIYTCHSFPILTRELVAGLVDAFAALKLSGRIADVGAGCGWLAYWLNRMGGPRLESVDNLSNCVGGNMRREVMIGDAVQWFGGQAKEFDAVVLSWPPYDNPFAERILSRMLPGQLLLYIGEDRSGCTATDAFFDMLESVAKRVEGVRLGHLAARFDGVRDMPTLYRIRGG